MVKIKLWITNGIPGSNAIDPGLRVASTENSSLVFETLGEIDFTIFAHLLHLLK